MVCAYTALKVLGPMMLLSSLFNICVENIGIAQAHSTMELMINVIILWLI